MLITRFTVYSVSILLYNVMCIALYLFVCFADFISAGVIVGIVLAVVVPLCCIGVCITIIVIAVCTGACAAGAASSRRGRRRNVNAAAAMTGAGNAPPPYTSTAYPATQPQEGAPAAYSQQQPAAYPDEQKVELQEYQADPAYPLQPPPTN